MQPVNTRPRVGLNPSEDAFAGTVVTECVSMKNYRSVQGVIVRGESEVATASVTFGLTNSQIVISWGTFGTVGNDKTVEIVESGMDTPLTVVVDEDSVVINLETDSMGDAVSTVTEVIAALELDEVFAEFWAASDGVGDGSGVLAAATEDVLAGGTDPGTSTITVEKCSDSAGSNPEAVEFMYRKISSLDIATDFVRATTSGFTTDADYNVIYEVLVDDQMAGMAEGDKPFVRVKLIEVVDVPVSGAVVFVAHGSRYGDRGAVL